MSKAIRKNAVKLTAQILKGVSEARAYTLENAFSGEPVTPERMAEVHAWHRKHSLGELRHEGNGAYRFRVHSNCWYEFTSSHVAE